MGWKKFASEWLGYSRRDRVAIVAILALILGVYFLPHFIPQARSSQSAPDSLLISALNKLETEEKSKTRYYPEDERNNSGYSHNYDRPAKSTYRNAKAELFSFDPNTINAAEWKRLGLRDKTIGTIQNYLSKGGKFRKPEDLKRVYGLFPDEYKRLEPYIQIGNLQEAIGKRQEGISNPQDAGNRQETLSNRIKKELLVSDINSADTTQLIALPGIGSKLALRIINFRDKLGGFYSIEQVGETFGLADSTFQKIKTFLKLGNTPIRKININTITLDGLKAHPYIRYAIAGPLIAYRNEHGPFKKIDDLKNIMAITEEVFNRILPYLIIE